MFIGLQRLCLLGEGSLVSLGEEDCINLITQSLIRSTGEHNNKSPTPTPLFEGVIVTKSKPNNFSQSLCITIVANRTTYAALNFMSHRKAIK